MDTELLQLQNAQSKSISWLVAYVIGGVVIIVLALVRGELLQELAITCGCDLQNWHDVGSTVAKGMGAVYVSCFLSEKLREYVSVKHSDRLKQTRQLLINLRESLIPQVQQVSNCPDNTLESYGIEKMKEDCASACNQAELLGTRVDKLPTSAQIVMLIGALVIILQITFGYDKFLGAFSLFSCIFVFIARHLTTYQFCKIQIEVLKLDAQCKYWYLIVENKLSQTLVKFETASGQFAKVENKSQVSEPMKAPTRKPVRQPKKKGT